MCDSYGVSVFRDANDAASYADKFPYLGDLVARGVLEEEHGKIAATPRMIRGAPNSHSTWWPFDNVTRHTIFFVSEEL